MLRCHRLNRAPAVFQILIASADQPLHGYGIMLDIAERSEGKVKLSPGTLYGSIKQMIEDGLIKEVASRLPSITSGAGITGLRVKGAMPPARRSRACQLC